MIPNKSNFKFQELPSITGVKPYVIRFWETEFEEIAPVDSDSGQKIYSRKDVEIILKIKQLLFDDKLSVREAKAKLHEATEEFHRPIEDQISPKQDLSFIKVQVLEAITLVKEIKKSRGWS